MTASFGRMPQDRDLRRMADRLGITALLAILLATAPPLRAVDPGGQHKIYPLNGARAAYLPSDDRKTFTSHGPATLVRLGRRLQIAADADGHLYVAEKFEERIRVISPDGNIVNLTGSGGLDPVYGPASGGDGGPSRLATLKSPLAVAEAWDGSVYLVEDIDFRRGIRQIRRIGPDGVICTIPTDVNPFWLAVERSGGLLGCDGSRVYRIALDGAATHIAGTGEWGSTGDGGPATEARISPMDIAAGPDGSIYIAEYGRVRSISPAGIITTVAGTGEFGFSGDGGPAVNAKLSSLVESVTVDSAGIVYIADAGNSRVRRIGRDGIIDTSAGSDFHPGRATGDGGLATLASLAGPTDLAVDSSGNLYIADYARVGFLELNRIRRVDPHGIISTIAGCGGCYGDGGHVTYAETAQTRDVARDPSGNLYFSDVEAHRVRRITPEGIISLVAGNGQSGHGGDNGPAVEASLSYPAGIAFDRSGNLYIADTANHRVRRVTPDGRIGTVAGTGDFGFSGDGGPATQARLANPEGVTVDDSGNLLISDTGNHRIRQVSPDGVITTLAGTNGEGFSGDGGPAVAAQLSSPRYTVIGGDGSVYVADTLNHRVRKVSPDGVIQTVAGSGPSDDWINLGDGGPATAAILRGPIGLALDEDDNLIIADTGHGLIRVVSPDGIIHSLHTPGFGGEGTKPLLAHASAVLPEPGGALSIASGTVATVVPKDSAPPELKPFIQWSGVTNSASFISGAVAPGQIISLWGERLAPDGAAEAGLGLELAGTRVFIGGLAAPLLFVSPWQVNAIVPFGVEDRQTAGIRLERLGDSSNEVTTPVLPVAPGLYTYFHSGVMALNQDYTPNSWSNPVRPGQIVMLWATGFGQTNPPSVDGAISEVPLARLPVSVTATIGAADAPVTYAGPAPGLVAGATQINLVVPNLPDLGEQSPVSVLVRAGGVPTQPEAIVWVSK